MYQTLEDLEYALTHREKKWFKFSSFFHELKILWLIFVVLFLGSYLITNAQLVIDNVTDYFSPTEIQGIAEDNTIYSSHWSAENSGELENLIQEYGHIVSLEEEIAPDMDHLLQTKLDSYEFSFNLLPPTNRLIIPAINLDVPLVETKITDYDNFTETTFDSDLENWVVKYPTTPAPWEWWNAFFFGHTSQEYWKTNPYGTVFRKIPQLRANDKIQVVWDGVLYEYKVLETKVVKPKQVNDVYVSYGENWKEYITLMWCYPIWRTDKRMMIFAERVS